MQRLLSLKRASSNLPKKLSNTSTSSSLLHSHHSYNSKPFSSLTKPQNQSLSSFLSHPLHHQVPSHSSWHRFSAKTIHGFFSNPVIAKQFLLSSPNTLLRVSTSKSLVDCRVSFLRAKFQRQSFRFNPSFDSHRRGWRSWFQGLTADGMVYGLIIANVAVYMLWQVADGNFMRDNFMISLDNFKSGRLHTLITSAFSHRDLEHIGSNMIGLYFFGMSIGRTFGPEFLLKLYIAGALGGSIFYLMHKAFLASSSKGASGAVNAIMLLNIFLFPNATLYFDFIIPVPAFLLGIFLIGKDVLRMLVGDSHISGSAHLGGAAVAAIAWARIRKGRF
ncbi:RHOMBOID-like protein 12, mitochondrial isoform X2 [Quercus lobata]|uniref:RHOMBOID-like protein 12, mitochondrial isoform X2 n=1 Tax=Quercus lobata TaxID=97700 RepID=UPI0012464D14|nr:RHOMBOID-like protein 12, mitochondrial isoform X2 [Quercus lobata]